VSGPDFWTIEVAEAVAAHLGACFDGLYRGLGAVAPTFTEDAHVVLAYELSRTFGECRHGFDELGAHRAAASVAPRPTVSEIEACLVRSATLDPTGALSLFAVASVIGPRLLVSLRDVAAAATEPTDGPLARRAREGATALVGAMHRIGLVARASSADEGWWREAAADLEAPFARAGYAESFGP
jgi:hypothetical protein